MRKLGVEIEFMGLDVDAAADLMAASLGGTPFADDPHRVVVESTRIGDVTVELDTGLAHGADSRGEKALREAAGNAVSFLVPVEIVAPPVPVADLAMLDEVVARLRIAGGKGTEAAPVYGFGVHFNVEVEALTPDAIVPTLRAFAFLEDWIRHMRRPDLSRRALPFIDPFPRDYLDRLAEEGYAPDSAALIRDYLAENPTRNRALDMLPILASMDAEQVGQVVESVSARPAFHYRLPDSRVGDPGWSLAEEWAVWVLIETVAARPAMLEALAQQWRTYRASWTTTRPDWRETVAEILAAHGLDTDAIAREES